LAETLKLVHMGRFMNRPYNIKLREFKRQRFNKLRRRDAMPCVSRFRGARVALIARLYNFLFF